MVNDSSLSETCNSTDQSLFWDAIVLRDASFDGRFFYGVRSTGIYCRPSCPSRVPRKQQVQFFALPEAAEHAGFRSCLRCKPRAAKVCAPHADLVQRVCGAIVNAPEQSDLAGLGRLSGLTPAHLQKVFKRLLGITPKQYASAIKSDNFKRGVRAGQDVTAAMYGAGYGSSSRLYEKSNAELGMTPATYGRGGKGARIRYAVVSCMLGKLLVATTGRGICSVTLGDSAEQLAADLRVEFPLAEIAMDNSDLRQVTDLLVSHLAGTQPSLDLPLDIRATAFQRRVWEELRHIPYGSTRSYGEIARLLGQPTAARAVARACATNSVALVNPCHRVVRDNGELSGYKWGVERKRRLLQKEKTGTDSR